MVGISVRTCTQLAGMALGLLALGTACSSGSSGPQLLFEPGADADTVELAREGATNVLRDRNLPFKIDGDDDRLTITFTAKPSSDLVADISAELQRALDNDGTAATFRPVKSLVTDGAACSAEQKSDRAASGEPQPVACFELGDESVSTQAVDDARATVFQDGRWVVDLTFTESGVVLFDELLATCFAASPQCATRQIATVLGDTVVSAPLASTDTLGGLNSVVSGDFDQADAETLAAALRSPQPLVQGWTLVEQS